MTTSRDGLLQSRGADDAAMGWQAIDARGYQDQDRLTNGMSLLGRLA
jgi:hypothetical protein